MVYPYCSLGCCIWFVFLAFYFVTLMIEISVYSSLDARSHGKCLYRVRPLVADVFDYRKCIEFLHMCYGTDCIIEILNV